jgi:hypothetical protein
MDEMKEAWMNTLKARARSSRTMRETHSFRRSLVRETLCFPRKFPVAPLLLKVYLNEVDTGKRFNKVRTPFSQINKLKL